MARMRCNDEAAGLTPQMQWPRRLARFGCSGEVAGLAPKVAALADPEEAQAQSTERDEMARRPPRHQRCNGVVAGVARPGWMQWRLATPPWMQW